MTRQRDEEPGDSFLEYRLLFLQKFEDVERALRAIQAEQHQASVERAVMETNIKALQARIDGLTIEIKRKTGPLAEPAPSKPSPAGDPAAATESPSRAQAVLEEVKARWQIYLLIVTVLLDMAQRYLFSQAP